LQYLEKDAKFSDRDAFDLIVWTGEVEEKNANPAKGITALASGGTR
jgi:hypothetical protein